METQQKRNFMVIDNPGKAIITGASSGIGEAFAQELARQGFGLILVARRKEKLDEIAKKLQDEHKISVETIAADLTDQQDVKNLAQKLATMNDLDILINNAGFGIPGLFHENKEDRQLDMIQVHASAPVVLMRTLIPSMIQRKRGLIINLSSFASFLPMATSAMYCATKAFIRILSESMAIELKGTGVQIQALCPGFTHTGFHSAPDYDNYRHARTPKFMWTDTDLVIKESLAGYRKKKAVVIPGRVNRFLHWLTSLPLMGPISRKVTSSRSGGKTE